MARTAAMVLVAFLVLLGIPIARAAEPVCAPDGRASVQSDDTVFGQDVVALAADAQAAASAYAIGH